MVFVADSETWSASYVSSSETPSISESGDDKEFQGLTAPELVDDREQKHPHLMCSITVSRVSTAFRVGCGTLFCSDSSRSTLQLHIARRRLEHKTCICRLTKSSQEEHAPIAHSLSDGARLSVLYEASTRHRSGASCRLHCKKYAHTAYDACVQPLPLWKSAAGNECWCNFVCAIAS